MHGFNFLCIEVVDVRHNSQELPHRSWLVETMLVFEVYETLFELCLQIQLNFITPISVS